jgi:chromosome segregation ATPase
MVLMARKHLIERGVYPSEDKIREFIGFGSDTTIHKLNSEILLEDRMKVLKSSIDLPEDLVSAYIASVANRTGMLTTALNAELDEKGRSLEAAVLQLEALRLREAELERQTAEQQATENALRNEIATVRAVQEKSEHLLRDTISEQAQKLQEVTSERDALHKENQRLMVDNATHAATADQKEHEIRRLNEEVLRLRGGLKEEKHQREKADSTIQNLREALDDKKQQLADSLEDKRELRAQLKDLQSSQTAAKVPVKNSKPVSGSATTNNSPTNG